MIVGTFIVALLAFVCACIALILALKKDEEKIIKEKIVSVEHAPIEHPFIYDEKKKVYVLDGDLEITGGVTCLKKGGKA